MRCFAIVLSGFIGLGCAARNDVAADFLPQEILSTARETNKPKFGPPPPGYVKIRGEAVPGWKPEDMRVMRAGAIGWRPLGPRPILSEYWSGSDDASGRVVSIAPHPSDPLTVYIASASGGVWKTTDGGVNWAPLTDELSNLNHGAVALDPQNPDIVYAGTGEYTTQSSGDGLFRSTDGGATWVRIATTSQVGSTCSGIAVDPSNSQIIHVTGNIGYCYSIDGGATWRNSLGGGRASSLVIDPMTPSLVYVGMHGDGIYRSTDGGATFTKLGGGLPSSGFDRIVLAIAPSNPDVLYAAMISGSNLQGFYRTANRGFSWTQKTATPNFPSPQAWYDAFVGVHPNSEDEVYCGGVFPTYAVAGVIKSTDGGNSWTDITIGGGGGQLHPDQHAIAFGPTGTIWVGNDGGVWKSDDRGFTWTNTNATLTVTQNYNIALHPTDPAQVMGGTQDNGTVGREMDIEQWPQLISGDGGFLAYDHADPTRIYTTYVYLSVYRRDSGGWANISGPWSSDPRNFIAPLVMDPQDSRTLLGGTDRVWRTQNADASSPTWTPISTNAVGDGTTLNAIAIAPSDSNVIYTGNRAGNVWYTSDAATWVSRSTGLPSGQISDIVIDPNDPDHAYVGYYNTSGARVLTTSDAGVTWTDITGNMPAGVSCRALAIDWRFDPPHIYSGSGVGVYSSDDGGATWIKDGSDLPNVNIGDLAIDPVRGTITAGTYGRGAWRAALPPLTILGDLDEDCDVDLTDLAVLLSNFEKPNPLPSEGDIDRDNDVDLTDLAILLSMFDSVCP